MSDLAVHGIDVSQYCGVWAMDETTFSACVSMVRGINFAEHIAANRGRDISSASVEDRGKVALVSIGGPMTKQGSSLSDAGSTVKIRQAIRAAASNPEIGSILLRIDSPGGTVAGTADLAAEVAAAKSRKPVYAYVEDMAASAAYWVASQATKVYANNATARVGSIGTYMVAYDVSRAMANEGIETVVIRTSPLKGAGVMGDAITPEQKADWQAMVDGLQEQFSGAVASGRGMTMEQVAAVATGRVYRASEAQALGLIDGIKSFDETLAELTQVAPQQKGRKPMAATFDDIKSACAGIDPSSAEDSQFICDQLAKGVEADAAAKNWMTTLADRAKSAREAESQAKAEAEAAKSSKAAPGVDPLQESGRKAKAASDEYTGDPVADFDIAVREKVAAGTPRKKAMVAVAKANPEMHQAFLLATNSRKVHGIIRDRFAD